MLSRSLVVLLLQAAPAVFGSPVTVDLQHRAVDNAEYNQLQDLVASAQTTAISLIQGSNGTCTQANLRIRREWDSFTTDEKKDYIRAVRCLQTTPSLTPSELGSGIKSRYDDFIATHMNQTLSIHFTGNFLTWHRYYIQLFENVLRDECSYSGILPYWNWPKTAITGLHASPVFDGSDTSLSGDGYLVPNKSDVNIGGTAVAPFWVPSGTGGGCVKSGPFVNYTLNLGPVALDLPGGTVATNSKNDTGIYSWNPRCLKRDLTDYINQNYANASNVLDVVQGYDSIADFQLMFQGASSSTLAGGNTLGVHGGGHFSLGGDPGRDFYVSPGDPVFYLHHGMIDRVWWLWQMQDPETRVWGNNNLAGTNTFMNSPPSANTTLDDWVTFDFAGGPPMQIKDLMSTTSGPFCYAYE
ncbi:hypothetical protein VSDG_06984 [Cytospora chrysosperma]|uniref:Tyrosinase copper-binding domain-containing protein n=1 Tax=Cytospora chrysosperma TaxID=252740 RepID=A0A423VS40_CYTCH|nr:hypothetical protein VSDG_06984 [Valsa sordida]